MAIQNFLSGGYYGKLGDTVGQRWKNKRTIKKYVIPHDPKTPAQQANRKKFGDYVPFAQLGLSANYRSPAFDSAINTEWALRMKTVSELYKMGEQDLGLVPLYPIDFEIPSVIDYIAINGLKENSGISFLISGNIPQTARGYSILMYFADGKRAGEIVLLAGESTDESPNKITCTIEDTSEIEEAEIYCRICTRDDETTQTIAASSRLLAEKLLKKDFATELTLHSATVNENGTITIIYTTQNEYSDQTQGTYNFEVSEASGTANLKSGTSETLKKDDFTTNFETVNINDFFAFKIALTGVYTAANAKNYTASINLQANFKAFCTDKTRPATATENTNYNAVWQNQQPQATITTQTAIASTDDNGVITTYIQTLAPYDASIAGNFTQSINVVGATGTLKDGTSLDKTSLTFTTNYEVVNQNGYFRLKYILTPNHTKSDMKNYSATIDYLFTIENYFTAETMPADINKVSAARTTWSNTQAAYNLTLGTPTASSSLDGTATITIPITSAIPENKNTITAQNISASGTVGLKENATWDETKQIWAATGTPASNYNWSVQNTTLSGNNLIIKIKSPNGYKAINDYYIKVTIEVGGTSLYTSSTMPANATATASNIATPQYWQNEFNYDRLKSFPFSGVTVTDKTHGSTYIRFSPSVNSRIPGFDINENGDSEVYISFDSINGELADETTFDLDYADENGYSGFIEYVPSTQAYNFGMYFEFSTKNATITGCEVYTDIFLCFSDDSRVAEYWYKDHGNKDLLIGKFNFSYS